MLTVLIAVAAPVLPGKCRWTLSDLSPRWWNYHQWRAMQRKKWKPQTLPLELAMNGSPRLNDAFDLDLRLSDVRLTFEKDRSLLPRQIVFPAHQRRHAAGRRNAQHGPLFSPSGLVYRYVLESPDRSPWSCIRDGFQRAYKSVPGVARRFWLWRAEEYHVLPIP